MIIDMNLDGYLKFNDVSQPLFIAQSLKQKAQSHISQRALKLIIYLLQSPNTFIFGKFKILIGI